MASSDGNVARTPSTESIRASCLVQSVVVRTRKGPITKGSALVTFYAQPDGPYPWIRIFEHDDDWDATLADQFPHTYRQLFSVDQCIRKLHSWLQRKDEGAPENIHDFIFQQRTFFFCPNDTTLFIQDLGNGNFVVNIELRFFEGPILQMVPFLRQMKGYVGQVTPFPGNYLKNFFARRRLCYRGEIPPKVQVPCLMLPFGYYDNPDSTAWYIRRTHETVPVQEPRHALLVNEPVCWPILDPGTYERLVRLMLRDRRRWYPTSNLYGDLNSSQILEAYKHDATTNSLGSPVANVLFESPFDKPDIDEWNPPESFIWHIIPRVVAVTRITAEQKEKILIDRVRFLQQAVDLESRFHPNAPVIFEDVEMRWCMLFPHRGEDKQTFPRWVLVFMPTKIPTDRIVAFTTTGAEYLLDQRTFFTRKWVIFTTEAPLQNLGFSSGYSGRFIRCMNISASHARNAQPTEVNWGIVFQPNQPDIMSTDWRPNIITNPLEFKLILQTANKYYVTFRGGRHRNTQRSAHNYVYCYGNSIGQKFITCGDQRTRQGTARYPEQLQFHVERMIGGVVKIGPLWVRGAEEDAIINFENQIVCDIFIRLLSEVVNSGFQIETQRPLEYLVDTPYHRRETQDLHFFGALLPYNGLRKYGPYFANTGGLPERFRRAFQKSICPPYEGKGRAQAEEENNFKIAHILNENFNLVDRQLVDKLKFYFETPFHSPHALRNGAYAAEVPWTFNAAIALPGQQDVENLENRLDIPAARNLTEIPQITSQNRYEVIFGMVVDMELRELESREVEVRVPKMYPVLLALPYRVCHADGIVMFQTVALEPTEQGTWGVLDVVIALTENVPPDALHHDSPIFEGNVQERWIRIMRKMRHGNIVEMKVDWAVIPYNEGEMSDDIPW